jgi:uroporphyrinogen decarboxylase
VTSRERVQMAVAHEAPDHVPSDDSFWTDTKIRFVAEGMPEDVLEADYFGFDLAHIYLDASPRLPERLLSETEDVVTYVSKSGYSCTKWKHKGGALHYFDHVTPTREAWESVKPRLVVDIDGTARISKQPYFDPFVTYPIWADATAEYREAAVTERYVLLNFYGPWEATWRHHGFVETCMDLAQDADWVADMFATYAELVCATISKGWDCGIRPDGICLQEDLGTTQSTIMSPGAFRQFLIPCYDKIFGLARAYGMSRFMHSDGRIHAVLDDLIEAGVQALNPIDTGSGMDLVDLRNRYGRRLTLYGGISGRDMHDVAKSNAEIDAKIPVAASSGGYIFHSDHSVPPTVGLKRYKEILQRVRALTTR